MTGHSPSTDGAGQANAPTHAIDGTVTSGWGTTIGVEEPELTVHPGALPLLFDYLKQASRRSQVIITTHSPDLLDLMDVEDVRVVTREQGITRVEVMAEKQRTAVRSRLVSLSEVMRAEGLQGELSIDKAP
jgi:predicted ATP-binding protein involved in virulence